MLYNKNYERSIKNKKIAVLCGGDSAEREVSLRSGKAVFDALLKKGYSPILIDVSADTIYTNLKQNNVGLAFIVLHGGYGENGAIQGLLEMLRIIYTGSGKLASALAMDKEWSKICFKSAGLNVPEYAVFYKSHLQKKNKKYDIDILRYNITFNYPWVVKPVVEGSSIGVSIVHNDSEIESAVKDAFNYGGRIIIERYIKGKEISIGILGDKVLGGVEIRPSLEFYDYKCKYTSGMTQYVLPPEIPKNTYEILKEVAFRAHKSLGCSGSTRVDLILDEGGLVYVLEVNTIPGMTATSLLPKIASLSGYSFEDLVELILLDAVQNS